MTISRWPRIFPVSGNNEGGGKDTLWLKLIVKPLLAQNMDVRGESGGLTVGSEVSQMMFLLPMSYSETINHDWDDIDTIAGKIAEKYRSTATGFQQLSQAASAGGVNRDLLQGAVDSAIRPDSPTIFKSSQKRDLPLTFHLADQGDTERDIFEPINLLMYYSSSGMADGDDVFKISYPYIFELQSITGDNQQVPLIKFQHAALTSVQPTYFGPYRNGYPTKCELTLQFKDLQPLFKRTFEEGPVRLTVSEE